MHAGIGFIIGGVVCSALTVLIIACLRMSPVDETGMFEDIYSPMSATECSGSNYTDGFRDGWNAAKDYYEREDDISDKTCVTCVHCGQPTYDYPCTICDNKDRWEGKDDKS